jgi:hypothetical protein
MVSFGTHNPRELLSDYMSIWFVYELYSTECANFKDFVSAWFVWFGRGSGVIWARFGCGLGVILAWFGCG